MGTAKITITLETTLTDPTIEAVHYCALPVHDRSAPALPTMHQVRPGHFQASCSYPVDAYGSILAAPVREPLADDPRIRWQQLQAAAVPLRVTPAIAQPMPGRLAGPAAPPRLGWTANGGAWQERVVGSTRVYYTAPAHPHLVVLLCDGQLWKATALPAALTTLAARGYLPSVQVIAVDTSHNRAQNLAEDDHYLAYLVHELLPAMTQLADKPVIVAGQSLGGLAALRMLAQHRDTITGAIANSPSLWWPDRDGSPQLPHLLGQLDYRGAVIHFSAGLAERNLCSLVAQAQRSCQQAGAVVTAEFTNTAHEIAAWEGALTRGLLRITKTMARR
ncbi:alpha/beta hydrolase [Corynebacterium choanae]|uniref:Enterochelin esterase n=1 Tax=Corynebacterium choanae TaxID=1862358 RepID=A0A3G6JBI5_9CORY|nr:alpha/beta hydrolase-fold protein [Corynebacterium choanae]AZA14030.1 Enterochelin esterase [Corynebacterium choanae]